MNIIVGITRELNKESLLNCYPIYINYRWSVLSIINPTLKFIYCFILYSYVFHKDTMLYTCALTSSFSPLLAHSNQVQAYDLTSCDMSCNLSHVSLHHQKEKEKENQKKRNMKSRKIDKRKRKMLVFKHTITPLTSEHKIFQMPRA